MTFLAIKTGDPDQLIKWNIWWNAIKMF